MAGFRPTQSDQQQIEQQVFQNPRPTATTSKKGLSRKETKALVTGEVASDGTTKKRNINYLPDGELQWDNEGTWGKSWSRFLQVK